MEGEEYEIIPHEVLNDLKDEVHILKERLSRPIDKEEKELMVKISSLSEEIEDLKLLINSAVKSVEGEDESNVVDVVNGLNNRINTLESQNEQIANALITLSQTNQKIIAKVDSVMMILKQRSPQQNSETQKIKPFGDNRNNDNFRALPQKNIPELNPTMAPPKMEDMPSPPEIEDVKEKKKSIFDIFK